MVKNTPVPLERTHRLDALRKQAKAASKKLFGGGHDPLGDNPLARRWQGLLEQIRTLENSFVLYQGREINAELVNYMSGAISSGSADLVGDEKLYRDEQGHYYLYRKLDGAGRDTRTHLHRISITAAILWATTRANCLTFDLRNEAVKLLAKEAA